MKDLSKSIDFLLENAGPVIQYRLRKEILQSITTAEEESLLNEIYQTPYFKLVQRYVKPSGYIGSGMHRLRKVRIFRANIIWKRWLTQTPGERRKT